MLKKRALGCLFLCFMGAGAWIVAEARKDMNLNEKVNKFNDIGSIVFSKLILKNDSANEMAVYRGESDILFEAVSQGVYGVYIGQSIEKLEASLGSLSRVDPSAMGGEWRVYRPTDTSYVLIGVSDGRVVEIYSPSADWSYKGIKVGSTVNHLKAAFAFSETVSFRYDGAQFSLLNVVDERPLAIIGDTVVIFYLDRLDNDKVAGIRLMPKERLVKSKLYSVRWNYVGAPPDVTVQPLTEEQRTSVDRALERQIFDLTNEARALRGLPRLRWNERAADVARKHCADMRQHEYFDHVSPATGLDPFQRLRREGVPFRLAGENIAIGGADAIETHHGWMNSADHRNNILHPGFETLGVGVVGSYGAQNFVTP